MFSPQQAMAIAERILIAVENLEKAVTGATLKADSFIRPTYRKRVTQVGNNPTGGALNFDMNLGGPAQGYEWIIERISIQGTGTQPVYFYEGDPAQGGTLIERILVSSDGFYSDAVGETVLVSSQREVVARLMQQAAGQAFMVSMQVTVQPADRPAF